MCMSTYNKQFSNALIPIYMSDDILNLKICYLRIHLLFVKRFGITKLHAT
jgi:hypothetical protein